MFYPLLFTQNVSIVFLSVKLIIMKIKEWDHISLTSNISAKTWSNCTSRDCFEIVRTSKFQNWPWWWKSSKIWGSNRAKQNKTNLWSWLYSRSAFIYLWHLKTFLYPKDLIQPSKPHFWRGHFQGRLCQKSAIFLSVAPKL